MYTKAVSRSTAVEGPFPDACKELDDRFQSLHFQPAGASPKPVLETITRRDSMSTDSTE